MDKKTQHDQNLTIYDSARHELENIIAVDGIKDHYDKSAAIMGYAKRAKNKGLEVIGAEMRARSLRKLGELTLKFEHASPGVTAPGNEALSQGSKKQALKEAGISSQMASLGENMAAITDSDFEDYIAKARELQQPVNDRKIVATFSPVKKKEHKPSEQQKVIPNNDDILKQLFEHQEQILKNYDLTYLGIFWHLINKAHKTNPFNLELDEIDSGCNLNTDDTIEFIWHLIAQGILEHRILEHESEDVFFCPLLNKLAKQKPSKKTRFKKPTLYAI